MIAACRREGALVSAMTGSGSSVFGLFPETVAKRAVPRLQRPDWLVILSRTLARKEAQRRIGLEQVGGQRFHGTGREQR